MDPLWRSTIGFDRLFDVLDEVQRTSEETYPPYNIERTGQNRFQISVALAGFMPGGSRPDRRAERADPRRAQDREGREALPASRDFHARSFKRQFTLADHVEVKGASSRTVFLIVDLVREIPEAMKPRQIAINAPGFARQCQPDRSEGGLGVVSSVRFTHCRPCVWARRALPTLVINWRRPCGRQPRMTTTFSISILLLHPGAVFERSRDLVADPRSDHLREARDPRLMGIRRRRRSRPARRLRAPDGLKAPVTIDEILDALCALDEKVHVIRRAESRWAALDRATRGVGGSHGRARLPAPRHQDV